MAYVDYEDSASLAAEDIQIGDVQAHVLPSDRRVKVVGHSLSLSVRWMNSILHIPVGSRSPSPLWVVRRLFYPSSRSFEGKRRD